MPLIPPEQYIGKQLGNFTVLSVAEFRQTSCGFIAYVNARCKCGTLKVVRLNSLKTGRPATCGCGRKTAPLEYRSPDGAKLPEYQSWSGMTARCHAPSAHGYERYGGRGITICERWKGPSGFKNFCEDMGPRPSLDYEVDRIDNDGNYEPGNCRWATVKQQARNRSSTHFITMFGRTLCSAEWGDLFNIDRHTVGRYVRNHGEREAELHFSNFAPLACGSTTELLLQVLAEPSALPLSRNSASTKR